MPSTTYSARPSVTTTYIVTRLGGEYLLDWNGIQILDWNSNPIVTIVPGGQLPMTTYISRPLI